MRITLEEMAKRRDEGILLGEAHIVGLSSVQVTWYPLRHVYTTNAPPESLDEPRVREWESLDAAFAYLWSRWPDVFVSASKTVEGS